jgi:hypothetical protein
MMFVGRALALSFRYWQFWAVGAAAPVFAIGSCLVLYGTSVFGTNLSSRHMRIVGTSIGVGLWWLLVVLPFSLPAWKAGRRVGREIMMRRGMNNSDGVDS